jgi:tight adherence protein C
MDEWGIVPGWLGANLAVLGLDLEVWGSQVLLGGLALMAIGALGMGGLTLLGGGLPPSLAAGIVVFLGALSVALPLQDVHARAGTAREHFRQVFVTWLELVTLGQAAGAGVEGAMASACELGDDWALRCIAGALAAGRGAGVGPWEGLRALAAEVGVEDLARVAASLSLAGTEGARVRASLSAAAGSLRTRALSESEGRANALTERLFLPAILLAAGFMLFILYPALSQVLGSLGGG